MLVFSIAHMSYKRENKREHKRENHREDKLESSFGRKKRWAPYWEAGATEIDFKDMKFLSRFVTERGKILPRRITGLTAKQQKMITRAIKRARQMSLLPFLSYGG